MLSGGYYNPAMAMMGMMNYMYTMPTGAPRSGAAAYYTPAGSMSPFGGGWWGGTSGYLGLYQSNPYYEAAQLFGRVGAGLGGLVGMSGLFGTASGFLAGRGIASGSQLVRTAMMNIGRTLDVLSGRVAPRRGPAPPPSAAPGAAQGGGQAGGTTATGSTPEDSKAKEEEQYQKNLARRRKEETRAEKKQKEKEKKAAKEKLGELAINWEKKLTQVPYGYSPDEAKEIVKLARAEAEKAGELKAPGVFSTLMENKAFPTKKLQTRDGGTVDNEKWARQYAEWVAKRLGAKNHERVADALFEVKEQHGRKKKLRDPDYIRVDPKGQITKDNKVYDRFDVVKKDGKTAERITANELYRDGDGKWYTKDADGSMKPLKSQPKKYNSVHGTLNFRKNTKLVFHVPPKDTKYTVPEINRIIKDEIKKEPASAAAFAVASKGRAETVKKNLETLFGGADVAEVKVGPTKIEITPKGSGDEKGINADKIRRRIEIFPNYFRARVSNMNGAALYVNEKPISGEDVVDGAVKELKGISVRRMQIATDVRAMDGGKDVAPNANTIFDKIKRVVNEVQLAKAEGIKKLIVPVRFIKKPAKSVLEDVEKRLKEHCKCGEVKIKPKVVSNAEKIKNENMKPANSDKREKLVKILEAAGYDSTVARGGMNALLSGSKGTIPSPMDKVFKFAYGLLYKKAVEKRKELLELKGTKDYAAKEDEYKTWFSTAKKYLKEFLKGRTFDRFTLEEIDKITSVKTTRKTNGRRTTRGVQRPKPAGGRCKPGDVKGINC